jgi:AbrB family looped-hinge helix DNA binding protein
MYEQVGVMTRKGQVTVPADIRRALGLREGDKVIFALEDATSGQMTVRPVRSVAEMTYGAVTPRRRPADLKALRAEALEEAAEEVLAETPRERRARR